MSQLPRYDSYKDSGVQWLGEIPSHWKATRIKFLGDIVLGLTYSPEDVTTGESGTLVLRSSNVQNGVLTLEDNVYVEKSIPQKMITTDQDILICSRNGSRALIGKCALIEGDGVGQTFGAFMTVLRSPYRKYLYYVLSSDLFKYQIGSFLTSTINQLTTYALGNFEIAFPPVEEQEQITDFLDKRLAQVDALIAKQETLLEKLAEQRVALISHAVTKGLNPDVEMKESGISWFNQIPKSWDVKQLKFVITKIQTGSTPPSAVPEYYSSDDIVWYGPADFSDENYILNDSVKKISALALEDKVVKPMPKGSIMMIGIGATLGKVAITNVDCTTNQQINSLTPIESVNSKYLMYQLNSLRDIVKLLSSASTLGIINQEKTKCLKIIVPSLNDQNEIVEFLDKELNEISEVKKSVEETINKLKEYRSTLITQVVTGKIDVRKL